MRKSPRTHALLIGLALATGTANAARADEAVDARAQADALFEQARDLMGQGLFGDACPKLSQSLKLAASGRTSLALAMCHEGEGKLATALVEFRAAREEANRDKRDDRVKLATEHADAIAARVSKVTVSAMPAPGLVVTIDGAPIEQAKWTAGIAVDAGSHVVRATAPHRHAWETTLRVAGSNDFPRVAIPALEQEAPIGTKTATPEVRATPSTGKRVAAWTLGGVAVAAIGVGTYFGIVALNKQSDADPFCRNRVCDQAGVDLVSQAKRSATIADVALGAGIVALAVSVVLMLNSGGQASEARPPVAASGGATISSW